MPVRSLSSSILKWPDHDAIDQAVRKWAVEEAEAHPELVRLGYFGSYARGDWGVGSDLDLIAIVRSATDRFEQRANCWELNGLPVAADLLIYTEEEWDRLIEEGGRFARTIQQEAVWMPDKPE